MIPSLPTRSWEGVLSGRLIVTYIVVGAVAVNSIDIVIMILIGDVARRSTWTKQLRDRVGDIFWRDGGLAVGQRNRSKLGGGGRIMYL